MKVPLLPPLSSGGGTAASEPPPFLRRLSCRRGGRRTRLRAVFYPDDYRNDGRWPVSRSPGACCVGCSGGRFGRQGLVLASRNLNGLPLALREAEKRGFLVDFVSSGCFGTLGCGFGVFGSLGSLFGTQCTFPALLLRVFGLLGTPNRFSALSFARDTLSDPTSVSALFPG